MFNDSLLPYTLHSDELDLPMNLKIKNDYMKKNPKIMNKIIDLESNLKKEFLNNIMEESRE